MKYKDILAHLDNSAHGEVRMNLAVELAVRYDAHFAALYALALASPAMFMGGTSVFDIRMADEILAHTRRFAMKQSQAVKGWFEQAGRRTGIVGEWRRVEVPAAIATHGPDADLIIVGQTEFRAQSFGTGIL
jgi:nucleotide-binding universal stress UspA family protein